MNSTHFSLDSSHLRKLISVQVASQPSQKNNIVAPLKFIYVNKGPRSLQTSPPNLRSPFTSGSTSPNIGPGKYHPNINDHSPSFEFSRCKRFGSGDFFENLFLHKEITEKDKKKIKERIVKNKEEALKSREERIKLVQARATMYEIRGEVTRNTKKHLEQEKKAKISSHLKDKFRKYRYRMRLPVNYIQELAVIKKTWITLISAISFGTCCRLRVTMKKISKKNVRKFLTWFVIISKCIGKFIRLNRNLKYAKSMRVIRINLLKPIKFWLKSQKKYYSRIIAGLIEQSLTKCIFDKLISQWKSKIVTIQRNFRIAIFFKISLYESLINKWNKAELEVFKKASTKRFRRRRAISISNIKQERSIEGCSSIPTDIKLYYMKKYIKTRMKNFTSEYKAYKIQLKRIYEQNMKNKYILGKDNVLEYPEKPKRPKIFKEMTLERYGELIFMALNEQSRWQEILSSQDNLHMKSYKQRIKY
ncbi:hypothetical protein SteCoe_14684 [Stentor coeruleus]|uniref:Uncharacterized protein n=1 Tax=Stentor coeruleus TaxID=5963 RepID=A0A1R2C5K0_9CILI|nr:hypothetical protein SteCoe_14684 [Stentor coeruleus]